MVILESEEYCFLYDRPSLPELLDTLLSYDRDAKVVRPGCLTVEQAREIARGLLGKVHQEV